MKPMKVLMAGLFVGASACMFSACELIEKLPTWMGGMGDAYMVTITINGESQTVKVAEDAIPQKPADPVREGYDFQGWYLDEACTQKYNFDRSLNADSTLYAYFTEKEYVITCVVDGVEEEKVYKWSQTPNYVPKKDGWVFKSWYLDEGLTEEKVFTAPERAPLKVYAKFVEAYKVEFVVSPDGVSTENNEIVETELGTAPIKPADPKLEGYDFEGWFMDSTFKTPCNFDTVLDPETPIYAKLVEQEYKITYMVGGTEDVLSTVTYKYWSIPEEPKTPEHNGEYFFGWYTDEEFKNSFDFSYTLKKDTTIYAQFLESKPIFTVEELIAIKDYPAGNYQLQNDITIKRKNWTPIPVFSGKFDGNGYKIYDFTINTTSADSGFFVTNNGTIKNLTLENFIFTSNAGGSSNVGALVAINNGTVENCVVNNPKVNNNNGITLKNYSTGGYQNSDGDRRTANYGGLIGKSTATGIVKNCTVDVDTVIDIDVNANDGSTSRWSYYYVYVYIGGAIGRNEGAVENIRSTFKLSRKLNSDGSKGYTGTGHGRDDGGGDIDRGCVVVCVGGAVSYNKGTMTKCSATIDAEVAMTSGSHGYPYAYIGGLVEENYGTVTESVVRGKFENAGSGNELRLGGFVSLNSGLVQNCYSDVVITTNANNGYVGGFVAQNNKNIENCYALGEISSRATGTSHYLGGFIGYSTTNAQITNSFTAMDITIVAGSARVGSFVGGFDVEESAFSYCFYASDATMVKGEEPFATAIITGVNGETKANMYTEAFANDLYWENTIWKFDGTNAPSLLWESANA